MVPPAPVCRSVRGRLRASELPAAGSRIMQVPFVKHLPRSLSTPFAKKICEVPPSGNTKLTFFSRLGPWNLFEMVRQP